MKKIKQLLKDKKGATLLIVLSSMLFLITMGATTLTSSLSAAVVKEHQKDKTRIDLLAESVQMSLHDMLNANNSATGTNDLQTLLVRAEYNYTNDPVMYALYDKLTISVDETLPSSGGTPVVETHEFVCELDSQLQVSGNNVSGLIWVNAKIDLDPASDSATGETTYRIGYKLDLATYDPLLDTLTHYGNWTLVTYEKIES